MPVTFETVRKTALSLENAEEGTSYGTAALISAAAPLSRVVAALAAGFEADIE
jgi:hypothetical protein